MKKTLQIITIICAFFTSITLCSCTNSTENPPEINIISSNIVPERELFCLADTKEKAEEIASLYSIELVEYSYGVAVFHAEGDSTAFHKIIEAGKQQGWPELSLNTSENRLN